MIERLLRLEPPDPIDRLVDQGFSYHTARAMTEGARESEVVVDGIANATQQPTTRRPRRAVVDGPQYGEEAGVGYPGGVPFEHQTRKPMSDLQRERNAYYIGQIRQQLEESRRDRGSQQ